MCPSLPGPWHLEDSRAPPPPRLSPGDRKDRRMVPGKSCSSLRSQDLIPGIPGSASLLQDTFPGCPRGSALTAVHPVSPVLAGSSQGPRALVPGATAGGRFWVTCGHPLSSGVSCQRLAHPIGTGWSRCFGTLRWVPCPGFAQRACE